MTIKPISEMASSELFTEMTERQKDEIYRMVWYWHVADDVEQYLNGTLDEEETEFIVEDVANAFVYDGDYDCNKSYWDNIDTLIRERSKEYVLSNLWRSISNGKGDWQKEIWNR